MEAENIAANTDGSEALLEKTTFCKDGTKTASLLEVFMGNNHSGKVDVFKRNILTTLKAMKFDQMEKEE